MMVLVVGFYSSSHLGKDEVRLAYALDKGDLKRVLMLLELALTEYNSRAE